MGDVGRRVEELIDAMSNIGLDDTATMARGMLLDHVARIPKQHSRFDNLDRLLETLPSCFHYPHRVCVRLGPFTNIIRFIQIAVEALVVDADVEVEDVAIKQNSLIRYSVADHFVGRCADRFREVNVIQRGWI